MSIRDIKAAAAELAAHEAGADSLLCEDCGEHRALAAPHACNTTGEHSLGRYTRAGGAGGVGSGEPTPQDQQLRTAMKFIVGVLSDVDGYFLPDESFNGLVGEIFRAMTDAGLNPNDFAMAAEASRG